MTDVNHNQIICAAIDAQTAQRELSRLEATVIGQYICDTFGDENFWFDLYYCPARVLPIIQRNIANHYEDCGWAEQVAFDMLGTYCLNTPDYNS